MDNHRLWNLLNNFEESLSSLMDSGEIVFPIDADIEDKLNEVSYFLLQLRSSSVFPANFHQQDDSLRDKHSHL